MKAGFAAGSFVADGGFPPSDIEHRVDFQARGSPSYTGPTSIRPTVVEQVIPCLGKSMDSDIVVEAIPQNYGLITYNGFELTVS